MNDQIALPAMLMRGGSSKGLFIAAQDLPDDSAQRDQILLAAMGSPDKRQIDGVGGAHPLTSKVGIVSLSDDNEAELNFLFAQLQPTTDTVDTKPNCGNMLAAAVPFALETGMIQAKGDETTVRVRTLNTGMLSDITVQTPNGVLHYNGNAKIDSVPNTAAPIRIRFLDIEGSVAGSLLPTGNLIDTFELTSGSLKATCIDNGMPMVLVRATDLNRTAYESVDELNNDTQLKKQLEELRIKAGHAMGLSDVTDKNYPKMCLLNRAQDGGAVHTRCFIPHVCHEAIGVLAAVTIATACVMQGTVADGIAQVADTQNVSIEHPSGEFSIALEVENNRVNAAALIRTARLLMRGEVMIPQR